jgi:small-conductance mechanosensitive channel
MSLNFLNLEWLDNRVSDYLVTLITFLVGIGSIRILQTVIIKNVNRWMREKSLNLNLTVLRLVEKSLISLAYLGIFYLAFINLSLHPTVHQAINALTLILATILGVQLIVRLCEYFLRLYWERHDNDRNATQMTNALIPAIRSAVWILGIIFVLDNLGFNISAVLTGLGIGGIALALASQGIFEDWFSYFTILLDRPVELGDFIVVGEHMGTVLHIGIKTTRLQSVGSEEIIIRNKDLTSSRIRNFKRMEKRRISFKFRVAYETPQESLKVIPDIIRNIIEGMENVDFDRAHLSDYGDSSINYEVVYYVRENDYNLYMDIQQDINLKLKLELEKREIKLLLLLKAPI